MRREKIGTCESSGSPIYEGDHYHLTADGCYLSESYAPMLSDILRQHEEILREDYWNPGELNYETREEMVKSVASIKAEIQTSGDRKILTW